MSGFINWRKQQINNSRAFNAQFKELKKLDLLREWLLETDEGQEELRAALGYPVSVSNTQDSRGKQPEVILEEPKESSKAKDEVVNQEEKKPDTPKSTNYYKSSKK